MEWVQEAVTELLGRERERAAIERLLNASGRGPRGLLLEGEAGIGKTSLWRAARSASESRGHSVLSAAPTEAETTLPYSVLADLLDRVPGQLFASLPAPLRVALEAALLRRVTPEAATGQLAVCAAFLRVLRMLAADQQLLIALDDLQWADAPSTRVLDFALRRLEQEPIAIVLALRVDAGEYRASCRLLEAVGEGRVERVVVGPLSESAIDDMLLGRLDRPLRRPELTRLYAVSGGNPFFALELGRYLIEHPSMAVSDEPLDIPRSLADAVRKRITNLPEKSRDILVAVAALASPTDAVIGQLEDDSNRAIEAAIAAKVLERRQGRLRFTHPLLASAVYGMADMESRRQWHSRLARTVDDPESRAHHLALAATGPDAAVADALEAAGRSANARGAPDAACRFAEQSALLTPSNLTGEIERRRIASAEYRLRAGDAPGARAILEEMVRALPPERRPAHALRLLGNIAFTQGDLVEAERLLTDALGRGGDDRSEAIIERDLIRVLNQRADVAAYTTHGDRLAAIADRLQDPYISEVALRMRVSNQRYSGHRVPDEARQLAVALAENRIPAPLDEDSGVLHPLFDWAVVLKWSDDFAHARTLFKRVLEATEGRDESLRAPVFFHLAEMECWAGDWPLAALYTEECRKSAIHAGQQAYDRLWLVAIAMLGCYRGQLAAARVDATQALEISRRVGDDPYQCRALAILGSIELAAGNPADANRYFATLRERLAKQGSWHAGVIRSEGDEVETLLALGRLEEAEAVGARVAEAERRLGDPWQHVMRLRCQALITAGRGEPEAAASEFEATLEAHQALTMPLEQARVLLPYGTLLRRLKRKRAARDALRKAQQIFVALGATIWYERSATELARIPTSGGDSHGLSATEMRVAALVAKGRTNREVAQELFLSVKTVEANLSRVYDKLDVRSRSELAARMALER